MSAAEVAGAVPGDRTSEAEVIKMLYFILTGANLLSLGEPVFHLTVRFG